jgi:hypothetical protein
MIMARVVSRVALREWTTACDRLVDRLARVTIAGIALTPQQRIDDV